MMLFGSAPPLPDPEKEGEEYRKVSTVWAVKMDREFEVHTLEGLMHGAVGDYLCKGPYGETYPVKGPIFESTYVKAR